MNTVTARFAPAHFSTVSMANIPAYWTPVVYPLESCCDTWPCETEADAVALGESMVAEGLAEV